MVEEKNNEELRHLVRIMNTDLQGAKPVQYALTGLPGIGRRTAILIARGAGVNPLLHLDTCQMKMWQNSTMQSEDLRTLFLPGC